MLAQPNYGIISRAIVNNDYREILICLPYKSIQTTLKERKAVPVRNDDLDFRHKKAVPLKMLSTPDMSAQVNPHVPRRKEWELGQGDPKSEVAQDFELDPLGFAKEPANLLAERCNR